ncbi:MAG: hypothetical protein AB8B63_20655 [Granulosicoccus sp.]
MKSLSSIFSFDTLQGNPLALLKSPAFLLVAGAVFALDLAARVALPDDRIARGAYHSAELREQVQQYQQIPAPDLLIIGSSIAAVNFPPETLDATLRENGYVNFTSFNAGIRGCNYICIKRGIHKHYLSHSLPKNALLVVGPQDISSNNAFVVSRSRDFVASFDLPATQRWFRNTLSHLSSLYGFDEHIREFLTGGDWNFDTARVAERGHVNMGNDERPRYPEYPQFTDSGEPVESLESLIQSLKDKGVHVIILPILGDSQAIAKLKGSAKQDFFTLARRIATTHDVSLLEALEGHLPDEAYIDDIHLNYPGAREHGKLVAMRLLQQNVLPRNQKAATQ